eukprot:7562994-Pyramimonas_sp.AAC.2
MKGLNERTGWCTCEADWAIGRGGAPGRKLRGDLLTTGGRRAEFAQYITQSDAWHMGIFARWTNRTQEAWVYSQDGGYARGRPQLRPARIPGPLHRGRG